MPNVQQSGLASLGSTSLRNGALGAYACSTHRYYFQTNLLRLNSSGYPVEHLQEDLRDLGFYDGPVNQVYTPETVQAVRAFQRAAGITVDGLTGPETKGKLCAAIEGRAWRAGSSGGSSGGSEGGSGSGASGGDSFPWLYLGLGLLAAGGTMAALR